MRLWVFSKRGGVITARDIVDAHSDESDEPHNAAQLFHAVRAINAR